MSSGLRVGERWDIDPRKLLLRPYDGTPQDLTALTQVCNDTLRATTLPEEWSEIAPEDMDRFYNRGAYSLTDNAWLMLHDGEPVAAAIVFPMLIFYDRPQGNFHLYVVPRLWSHGIGSRLLAHLEQAAIERGHAALETTVAREDTQSSGFLLGHGFKVVGQTVHLVRNGLDQLPDVSLPPFYSIKSLASLGEQPDFYRETANRLGSYDPNYTLITTEDMDQQSKAGTLDPEGPLFLLDPNARIVGVIRATQAGDERGYLHEIRLEPASRGKGLGMALVAAAMQYLASKGVTQVELDSTSENTTARNLAGRAGFVETRHWLRFLKQLRSGV